MSEGDNRENWKWGIFIVNGNFPELLKVTIDASSLNEEKAVLRPMVVKLQQPNVIFLNNQREGKKKILYEDIAWVGGESLSAAVQAGGVEVIPWVCEVTITICVPGKMNIQMSKSKENFPQTYLCEKNF